MHCCRLGSLEADAEMDLGVQGIFLEMSTCGREGAEAKLGRETLGL